MHTELLESRRMLSVSPVSHAVTVDRAAIKAALVKFKSDAVSIGTKIEADAMKMNSNNLAADTTLAPLLATLKTDVKNEAGALTLDHLTQGSAVVADQNAIVADLKQIKHDHGNATALATDATTLLGHRIQLQTDEIAELDARFTLRTTLDNRVFADLTAITTAAGLELGVSAKFTAALAKFNTDSTTLTTKLPADLAAITPLRTQLITDLTALQTP